MVEHATVNRRVVGSSPTRGAIHEPDLSKEGPGFFLGCRLVFQRKTATGNKKITVPSKDKGPRPSDFRKAGLFYF